MRTRWILIATMAMGLTLAPAIVGAQMAPGGGMGSGMRGGTGMGGMMQMRGMMQQMQGMMQQMAEELSREQWLVFACGRYEGIDQRVMDHYRSRMRVREVSIGDYVLNGGEVAALVVVEAVVRLLPGFMGNPDSLAEESHSPATGGLLE